MKMSSESLPRIQPKQQQQQQQQKTRKSSLFTIDSILENKKEQDKVSVTTNSSSLSSSSSSSSPTILSSTLTRNVSNLKPNFPKASSLNINIYQPYPHLHPQLNDTQSVFNQFFHAASSKSTIILL
jgi:hypothetical protein